MNSAVAVWMVAIGLVFTIMGTIGLVRLPDIYNRLQAATKCVTLGISLILVGILVEDGLRAMGVKALICAVFIILTSPVGAHAIARGAHLSGVKLWEKSVCDAYRDDRGAGEEGRSHGQTEAA